MPERDTLVVASGDELAAALEEPCRRAGLRFERAVGPIERQAEAVGPRLTGLVADVRSQGPEARDALASFAASRGCRLVLIDDPAASRVRPIPLLSEDGFTKMREEAGPQVKILLTDPTTFLTNIVQEMLKEEGLAWRQVDDVSALQTTILRELGALL